MRKLNGLKDAMASLLNRIGLLPGRRMSSSWAWLAAALGVAASGILYLLMWRAEETRDETEFSRQVGNYLGALHERRNATGCQNFLTRSVGVQTNEQKASEPPLLLCAVP